MKKLPFFFAMLMISTGAMAQSGVRKSSVNRAKQVSVQNVKKQDAPKLEDDDEVCIVAEEQPEFPGGLAALMTYIQKNLKYPPEAAKNGIGGRVNVTFIVEKDGTLSNIGIIRSPDPSLSKEAIRVVSSMPKWQAGRNQGKLVRVKYVLPITFRAQNVNP